MGRHLSNEPAGGLSDVAATQANSGRRWPDRGRPVLRRRPRSRPTPGLPWAGSAGAGLGITLRDGGGRCRQRGEIRLRDQPGEAGLKSGPAGGPVYAGRVTSQWCRCRRERRDVRRSCCVEQKSTVLFRWGLAAESPQHGVAEPEQDTIRHKQAKDSRAADPRAGVLPFLWEAFMTG